MFTLLCVIFLFQLSIINVRLCLAVIIIIFLIEYNILMTNYLPVTFFGHLNF